MPQILAELHTEQPHTLDNYCRAIHSMDDTDELQNLHHEISTQLAWRSDMDLTADANPSLGDLSVRELRVILQKILERVVAIMSTMEAALRQKRYAG